MGFPLATEGRGGNSSMVPGDGRRLIHGEEWVGVAEVEEADPRPEEDGPLGDEVSF